MGKEVLNSLRREKKRKAVSTWTEAKGTDQPQSEFKHKGKHTRQVLAPSDSACGGGPDAGILGPW